MRSFASRTDGKLGRLAGDQLSRADLHRAGARQPRVRDARAFGIATSRWSRRLGLRVRRRTPATSTLLKQQEVPGGFDSARYASERLWVEAAGWSRRFRSRWSTGATRSSATASSPLYVYGYGSYGYPLPLGFSRVAAVAAGPRRGDGLCAYSRRWRDGRSVARRRQDDGEAQHVHRLHRRDRASGRARAMAPRTAWRSKAAARAAC